MGRKADVENEMKGHFENYQKLKAIKKKIEHSEFWGITNRINAFSSGIDEIKNIGNVPDGYDYAKQGFERLNKNVEKAEEMLQKMREWRNAQITMRDRVTEEMSKTERKIHELEDNYNKNKDSGDYFGIQMTHEFWRWF